MSHRNIVEPEFFYKDFRVVRINYSSGGGATAFWPHDLRLPGIYLPGDYIEHSRGVAELGFKACEAWFLTMARLIKGCAL